MLWFGCKHPAKRLVVEREATVEQRDADFNIVTYHLICRDCGDPVKVKHAACIGGVDAFLARGIGKQG